MRAMQRTVPAPHDLLNWLECAVVMDSGPVTAGHTRFPAMVSGMLVVRLAGHVLRGGAPVPPAALIGASTRASVYEQQGRVCAVGLVLRPEALGALFGQLPSWPLTDRMVPAAQALGAHWHAAERAIRMAADDAARVEALLQAVRCATAAMPQADRRRQHLLRMAEGMQEKERGAPPGASTGLRQRQRAFQAGFGMTPKQFQVIARLNRTLKLAAASGRTDAHLVAQQGYYDQSHMARDLRRLAGQPLQALVAASQAGPQGGEHWPLQVGAQAAAFAR